MDLFSYGFKTGISKEEAQRQRSQSFRKDRRDNAAAKLEREEAKMNAPPKRGPGRPRLAPELKKKRAKLAGGSTKIKKKKRR